MTGAGDALLAGCVFARTSPAAGDPLRCGLAAASLALESPAAVPADLSLERLLERAGRHAA